MFPDRHHIWKKRAALLLLAILTMVYAIKGLHQHPSCEHQTAHCYTCEFQLSPAGISDTIQPFISLPVAGIIFATIIPAFLTITPKAAINRGPPSLA